MRTNHVPRRDRLLSRIGALQTRKDVNHVPSPSKGNPYYCCKVCGIHDPELSIRNGRHFGVCPMQGIDNEIAHYRKILETET